MDTENCIEELLKKVARSEGVIKPVIKYNYQTKKGDGYVGLVKAMDITGDNKTIPVIIKSAPTGAMLREQMFIRELFLREIYFYEKIIPTYLDFQADYPLQPIFNDVPKFYAAITETEKELLILENIKNDGYNLWNRQIPMNKEHVEFVFAEYGKFHGVSFGLKHKRPQIYSDLTANMDDIFLKFMNDANNEQNIKLVDNIKTVFEHESDISKRFNKFADNVIAMHLKTFESTGKYDIILHGDCWCNNMMFKYEDSNFPSKPGSMRLLDFQISRLGSPVLDLSYFLYTCASKDILNNLDMLLKIYYDNLSKTLKNFELVAEEVYPFRILTEQWNKFGFFGIILSLTLIKVMLSDSEEAPDLGKIVETDGNFSKMMDYKFNNEEQYKRRMKDIFEHCYERNII